MRKQRAPLGWPRRDPRHYRFPVPNTVWEYKLRPMDFVILFYLCYRQVHNREQKEIRVEVMADVLHLTNATVEKHLAVLISKSLITTCCVPTFKCGAGNFFSLPNEIFLLGLPPSAFVVYACLLCREDRRSHQCHPSCRTIVAATGLSLNTVVKAVDILTDKELIAVEHTCWFNEQGMKRNGNNLYTILPIRIAVEDYHQRQLRQLELAAERNRIRKRQAKLDRRRPTAAPCASASAPATPDPSPAT